MANEEFIGLSALLDVNEEMEGFVPEADANAFAAPVPDGEYLAYVRFTSDDADKRWAKKVTRDKPNRPGGKTYLNTSVTARLINTPGNLYDGREINMMNCMTLVGKNGTCGVQGLIQGLGAGNEIVGVNSHGALAKKLNDLIGDGEQLVGIRTRWEASIYDEEADETIFGPVRGMRFFPEDGKGGHLPEIQDPKSGKVARAFANISAWIPAANLTDGEEGAEDTAPTTQTAPAAAPKPTAAAAPRPVAQQTQAAPATANAGGPPIPARAAGRPRAVATPR